MSQMIVRMRERLKRKARVQSYKARVAERQIFERSICVEAERRLRGIVTQYSRTDRPDVYSTIWGKLRSRLYADNAFLEQMGKLEALPVGERAWEQRLDLFLQAAQRYLPEAVSEQMDDELVRTARQLMSAWLRKVAGEQEQ